MLKNSTFSNLPDIIIPFDRFATYFSHLFWGGTNFFEGNMYIFSVNCFLEDHFLGSEEGRFEKKEGRFGRKILGLS